MRTVLGLLGLPVFLAFLLPRPALSAEWPGDSGSGIGSGLAAWYEPSGIVWHDELGVLFLVSDNGYVSRMGSNGSGVVNWYAGGYDLEGITVADFSSTRLYLGVENPDSIFEFDVSTGALTGKSWDLTPWMASVNPNSGLEALTFVPDGHHPYGTSRSAGLFYAGMQEDGKIYIFDVDLSSSGSVSHVATLTPVSGRSDLSDMQYNMHTRTLYLIYDSSNYIREIMTDNTYIAEYTLPGADQEGISFVRTSPSDGVIYMGQDTGGVKKYADYPVIDTDRDGLTDAEEYWHDGTVTYRAPTDTNPSLADTDGDTYTDYIEIQSGTDPLSSGSTPASISVNFQPFMSTPPSGGYCIDSGSAKASTGYGWYNLRALRGDAVRHALIVIRFSSHAFFSGSTPASSPITLTSSAP
ncbi:MAG: esterase-like activity of phytase family protein [Chlamydiota bacterium]